MPPSTAKLIQDFLAEQLERLKRDVPDHPAHVVAVILMGEASPAAMEEMKITLETAIPEYADRFKLTIDPMHVVVQAAARPSREASSYRIRIYESANAARYRGVGGGDLACA